MIGPLLGSMLASAAVGLVLGIGILLLGGRSPRWAALVAPLVGLVAILVGVSIGAQQMVIDDDTRTKLLLLLVATAPVALASGVAVSSRVRAMKGSPSQGFSGFMRVTMHPSTSPCLSRSQSRAVTMPPPAPRARIASSVLCPM